MIDLYQEFAELTPRDLAAVHANQVMSFTLRVISVWLLAAACLSVVWGWYVKRGRGGLDVDRS